MTIEALKEQARRHEQKEEWQKALDQYKKAIAKLDKDDQPDIGLYNRVGDLYVRVGDLSSAVDHYERAVDLYMESELPNNAIAVLKKVIRNVPERHQAFLKMGQVRASQGFLPDARTNFLTYAERMQQAGNMDESFRALVEFCDLAPGDVALRRAVADQMASHERKGDAVQQLSIAYRSLMLKGETEDAATVEGRIRELNPDADLTAVMAAEPAEAAESGDEDEITGSLGEIEFGAALTTEEPETEEPEVEPVEPVEPAEAGGIEMGGFEITTSADEAAAGMEEEEEEAEALPTFDLGEEEEEGEALPTFDLGKEEEEGAPHPPADLAEEQEEEEEGEALPTFDLGEEEGAALPAFDREEEEEEEGAELPLMEFGDDEEGEPEKVVEAAMEEARSDTEPAAEAPPSMDEVRARIEAAPDDISLHQRFVELAYQAGEESVLVDAYMGLGQALQRAGQTAPAKAAFQQVLQLQPDHPQALAAVAATATPVQPPKEVASHEDYVDLGSLVLGDESERSTRFVVAYEAPSGDEAADFAKMLSQFKEKVSQNLDVDDVRAHHDLGTAYLEMGLLDEAVTEFQQALRSSQDHLPTYELLGQTFMEMGRYDAAVRSLERALDVPFEVEDDLVGIYYHLARAYEAVGNTKSALEFYDRVFSLDINFADVTERLRALR
ncbi:MAG: tetratricopeptide repeat protein [Gemmatimonadetes bacterium]|nr:tetratricopeptide repeat protein [Gemmatimonadota bacterium]